MEIRTATIDDAEAIRTIYNHEVVTSTATFDLTPRSVQEQRTWLIERSGAHVVTVGQVDNEVVGFGALSSYRTRPAYNTTVEDSLYVSPSRHGEGIGLVLLQDLVSRATGHGFHTMVARISHESVGSVGLHAKVGFAEVGHERQVGRKFGRWLDVVVMQLSLS
jgi:L-amino acid N-acyltransferase YncA